MKEECFNIHDIVKFKIEKKTGGLFSNKNPEYDFFRVNEVKNPDRSAQNLM